jgi:fumarate reductase subunit D
MARSNEPLWWSLFAAGGVVSAFLLPVAIVLTGIAVPAGWLSEERLLEVVRHPLARLYLLACVSLPLFHWAHRFRFTLVDLGLKGAGGILAFLCYGAAIAGTVLGAWLLFLR